MAIPVTIPRLGWNMEEGTFGGWLKQDGDTVRPGDRLFTLESEKAAEEIETLDAGILRIRTDGPKVGDVVAVGAVIGYLVERFEEELPGEPSFTPLPERTESVEVRQPAMPRHEGTERRNITPRARRAAAELGVDVGAIRGTGKGGRIRERDVRFFSPSPPASGGARSGVRGVNGSPGTTAAIPRAELRGERELIRLTPTRRTIAARMVESQRATAPVTLTTTVDATELVDLRKRLKHAGDPVPSYTDLIVKLCAMALQKHPLLIGQWSDIGISLPNTIDIGIAVDTNDGLRVPVVRDVPALNLRELAKKSRDLIERARGGKLTIAEMQGGCFTVTNLGGYGIDAFTPIINYPECAVLGVGRIARRPAVVGDTIVPRDQVTLSLTFDHRIVDGGPAARFLQTLSQAIENPGDFR
jgi:pyruvate dehydrogenase E2 component (dihydrolipoamide acetyltransferase)